MSQRSGSGGGKAPTQLLHGAAIGHLWRLSLDDGRLVLLLFDGTVRATSPLATGPGSRSQAKDNPESSAPAETGGSPPTEHRSGTIARGSRSAPPETQLPRAPLVAPPRQEEHTSEPQSLIRI